MLCLLHDSDEYGVLRWPLADIARAAGVAIKLLKELIEKGVLKGGDKGCDAYIFTPRHAGKDGEPVALIDKCESAIWYCSRFVRDEYIRNKRGTGTRFDTDNQPQNRTPKMPPKSPIGDGNGDGPTSSSSSSSVSALEQPHLKIVTGQESPTIPGQPGFDLDHTGFAKAVAVIYGEVYGVEPPPVPLMVAMGISQRMDFYAKCASLGWWREYFLSCWDDLFLTDRDSLEKPLGRKAAGFKHLVSEECIGGMIERSRREAAHG